MLQPSGAAVELPSLISVPVLPPDILPSLPRFPCPPGFTKTPGVIEVGRNAYDEFAVGLGAHIYIRSLVGQGGLFIFGRDFLSRKYVVGIRFALNNPEVLNVGLHAAMRRAINGKTRKIYLILPAVTDIGDYAFNIHEQLSTIFPDQDPEIIYCK